ncbi:orotidine-5'-phosphate decarboxylase [Aquiluna sp.]|nr:orotidine-5'-phosphate decarboxylase [Aquiluna sp.]
MPKYLETLEAARTEYGALCLGIDPAEQTLVDWGLPDSPYGLREFAFALIEAAEGRVGILKPQVAFFERFGAAGLSALEEVLQAARDADFVVIADAKRGDVGSTMLGYAQAFFGDDSPLRCDALTVSPYLGPTSLAETLGYAEDVGAGLFVLAATSNPEAKQLQTAKIGKATVAAKVVEQAKRLGPSCGVVIGATQDLSQFGLETVLESDIGIPILAPGFGHQGASLADVEKIFGLSAKRVICNVSRAATEAGPHEIIRSIEQLKSQL